MPKLISLRKTLEAARAVSVNKDLKFKEDIEEFQLKMLRIQQGIWHKKSRAIIVFEGFDAAGKGGTIRKLTKALDPRGFRVHSIGPPTAEDQGKHWLYRFWSLLPAQGSIAIFDRSWYGRVLVERVERLTTQAHWKSAYREINQFEQMLQNDGVEIMKIFLAITKDEQLTSFEDRLNDPYKQWKLTEEDLKARKKWKQYVSAVDDMFELTSLKSSPWNLIPADHKWFARKETLKIVTSKLKLSESWMERNATKLGKRSLSEAVELLVREKKGRAR